ncbi:glycosyltransferase family 4 protein [Aeromicrobium senzhongii]|uniref:Glycosyltransferase family 4 protein n=1 Tax=Aeromicrobium senzhongii TaxID=2663859 RepID=A0ABX6SVD0_9ACTN|nr:glycosyltransferase family 4 protein [Aeromicrobium senzhongii]MTB87999.1 glycosyltransferase [Aeromicrobium senzhongii]QNL94991.1 glycosyltransferase family 4 protein [Aeromicrobium senzhongii]
MSDTTVVVAHPSADVYGSDLQLLVTVESLVESGARVLVALPSTGPLTNELERRGAEVLTMRFPVLRKSALHPLRFARLVAEAMMALPRSIALLRRTDAQFLLVNTITIPWWLVAGRWVRLPTIGHVHEAEEDGSRLFRTLLALPNLFATKLIVNSQCSARALTSVVPSLRHRVEVVYNGVPGPPDTPSPVRTRTHETPLSLAVVGRLSPRKGIDVALEATAEVARSGVDVSLDVYGSAFEGYEWFAEQLHDRANEGDLVGRVTFHGYVNPVWPALARADVVLVPSRVEPFGNTAVEALLARRPLVASSTQGLAEIVTHRAGGLLAVPGDPTSLAEQILVVASNPSLARQLADTGHADALDRFGAERYRRQIRAAIGVPDHPDELDQPS